MTRCGSWVQQRDDPEKRPIGEAGLWGIDLHRRQAHLGLVLGRDCRGAGLGRDVIRVLCDYAFRVRGLQQSKAGRPGPDVKAGEGRS